jgi:hypothetical protein
MHHDPITAAPPHPHLLDRLKRLFKREREGDDP